MQPIIQFNNLSVAYDLGKTNEVWALDNIAGEIYPQEYVIFFGPSGCGKSTLLYTIAGLEFPTKGRITVAGRDLKNLSAQALIDFHRSTIGMIFQAYHLIPNLSVRDNILLPQLFTKAPFAQRIKKAKMLLQRFGILNLQHRRPSLLSGGQQQRVAIARALIQGPPIILADEPVGNLDSKNAEIVLDLLGKLNQEDKKTIVHVTHNPRDIHRANRVFYMQDGKIVREARNPKKLFPGRLGLAELSEEKISELERLAQAYPYLTESRLRAKLILHHLLLPMSIDVQQKIEEIIDHYLLKKIDQRQLFELLDASPEKGGANLYTQKAQQLSEKIVKLTKEIEMIKEEEYPSLTPPQERASELRGYLLDGYKGQLSFEQIQQIEKILLQRVLGQINEKRLEELLDLSLWQGGAGLNRRTAKRFSREIELILMK